ncbi:MAG: phosphate/phosphite/phosphonate ABC transporter substrate-binding protein [Pseudobdellovibrionaceae bacterium]
MVRRLILLFFLFFTVITQAQLAPREITIGILPGGDPEVAKRGYLEIAKALQTELQIPVNVYLSKNYSGLIEAMKTKKVDFAFFTAMTYVFAEKEAGAKVLLKKVWNEPFYYSIILSKKKSGIKTVEGLKNKRFGFVDEKSTSGYLYPKVLMKKKKVEPKETKFSGSHSQSIVWLDQGEVDAVAVFSDDKEGKGSAYVKYSKSPQPVQQVRVLWVSDPIPNDPFCVRQDFYDQYPKLTHNLMFALIDVVDKLKSSSKDVKETVGAQGFIPATQRQYDPVREMVKELDLHL